MEISWDGEPSTSLNVTSIHISFYVDKNTTVRMKDLYLCGEFHHECKILPDYLHKNAQYINTDNNFGFILTLMKNLNVVMSNVLNL